MRLTTKAADRVKQAVLLMWVGLAQSVEGLTRKRLLLLSLRRRGISASKLPSASNCSIRLSCTHTHTVSSVSLENSNTHSKKKNHSLFNYYHHQCH